MSLATQDFILELMPGKHPPHVKATQYDAGTDGWKFAAHLRYNDEDFTVPSGYTATVEGSLESQGLAFRVNATIDGSVVSFSLDTGDLSHGGRWWAKILLKKGDSVLQPSGFVIDADPAGTQVGTVTGGKGFEEQIKDAVASVMDEKGIGIDKTLTVSGSAADAKAVGDAIKNNFASKYDPTLYYAAGNYVVHDNKLYRARAEIVPEAWNEAHWIRASLADRVFELENAQIETDTTLTVQGAAADAKVAGDKVAELKSAINVENVNLQMVAKPTGINLFDSKQLLKNGITVSDGVYSGTASAYANAHGVNTEGLVIFGGFESNQRYTLSFKARNASTTSQSGYGLYVYVQYTDNTTDRVVVERGYTSFKALHLTSAANKTVKKYYFVVAQSPTIEYEIKEIYVEKGTTYTSYQEFELTAVDNEVATLRSDINAEITALDAKKPDKISLELLDTENIPKSPNLWDNASTTPGWINKSGSKVSGYDETHCHFRISGLSQGDILTSYYGEFPTSRAMRVITAYNSSGEAVSASGVESATSYTVPSGIVSVVVTSSNTDANNYFMVIKNGSGTPTKYYPYCEQHIDYLASPEFLKNVDLGVTIVEEPVYVDSVVALTNTTGVVLANGTIQTEGTYAGYKYSQKIPVSSGDVLIPISATGESNPYYRFLCAYNGNTAVPSAGSNTAVSVYTVPDGIDGVIVSTSSGLNIESVKKKHKTGTTQRTFPNAQKLGAFNWKGNLSNGSSVELISANVRFDTVWNITGHISTMGKITIGNKSPSGTVTEMFSVDGTNVYYKAPSGDVVAPHGLTIQSDLAIRIECDMRVNYLKEITVTSLGETFTIGENVAYSREMYGAPYLLSTGAVMTDCVFSWVPKNFDKPIWVFGDSWVSMYDTRWTYYMKQAGYTKDWMLNGFAGEKTAEGLESFKNLLAIRKPEYLVWLYGMNDGDTNGAVNANWKKVYDEIVQICTDYNINLILYTVPNTPTIDNSYKNAIVEASGYRYIDGVAAVGDDGSGNWFTGYEQSSSDHNHTSAKGAKALFHRILGDFPEIAGNSL